MCIDSPVTMASAARSRYESMQYATLICKTVAIVKTKSAMAKI